MRHTAIAFALASSKKTPNQPPKNGEIPKNPPFSDFSPQVAALQHNHPGSQGGLLILKSLLAQTSKKKERPPTFQKKSKPRPKQTRKETNGGGKKKEKRRKKKALGRVKRGERKKWMEACSLSFPLASTGGTKCFQNCPRGLKTPFWSFFGHFLGKK